MFQFVCDFVTNISTSVGINSIKIVCAYLTADFVMGLFHWFKDTYFTPFTPLIGKEFIWNSRLHHVKPRYIIEFTNRQIMMSSGKWVIVWMIPLIWLIGAGTFTISLAIVIISNDVVHKYAHMMDHERPLIITFLQKYRIIQSCAEHHLHHVCPYNINYCPITSYVNPVLEYINFWRNLESIISLIFKIEPRNSKDNHKENKSYPAGIEFIDESIKSTLPVIGPLSNTVPDIDFVMIC